jgi:hypothetical protein
VRFRVPHKLIQVLEVHLVAQQVVVLGKALLLEEKLVFVVVVRFELAGVPIEVLPWVERVVKHQVVPRAAIRLAALQRPAQHRVIPMLDGKKAIVGAISFSLSPDSIANSVAQLNKSNNTRVQIRQDGQQMHAFV